MKKTLLSILLFMAPCLLFAQVELGNESMMLRGDDVEVKFDLATTRTTLPSRFKIVLEPYIHNGADTMRLPVVEVWGKRYFKRERQEQLLAGNKQWSLGANRIMRGENYAYRASVPYQNWMSTASLSMERRMVGCNCDCYDGSMAMLDNVTLYTPPAPSVAAPKAEKPRVVVDTRRWDFGDRQMKVLFALSNTTLHPELYGNQAVLDEIIEGIGKIGNLDTLRLNHVEITGFASPEGSLALNTRLAEGRAEALRAYIVSRIPGLKESDFSLVNGIENWVGLRELVAASDMAHKDEVLNIIDTYSGETRKAALRSIAGGAPYRHMLDKFFPELRNACYIALYYDVMGHPDE
jgi:outer membrane protein OmpA-like peptidoglycan-associated protein